MRKTIRRIDNDSESKFQEVRKMRNAFGVDAAKSFGEIDFLDPALLKAALSFRYERRQHQRRAMDRGERNGPLPSKDQDTAA